MKMRGQSCYRLFAAIDFVLSTYTGILWWIVYTRSEGLLRLQFENGEHENLFARVTSYKAIIRSIGSVHNDNTSVEILHDMFHRVEGSCNSYYKQIGTNITVPLTVKQKSRLQKESTEILELCILLILVSIVIFMLLDVLIIITTRNGKISNKKVIFFVFFFQLVADLGYIGAALELRLDPRFCWPSNDLRPMVGVFILTAVCKPLQIYAIARFFRDVQTGACVEEPPDSDLEINDMEGLGRRDTRQWPNDRTLNNELDTQEQRQMSPAKENERDANANAGLGRKGNLIDITGKV